MTDTIIHPQQTEEGLEECPSCGFELYEDQEMFDSAHPGHGVTCMPCACLLDPSSPEAKNSAQMTNLIIQAIRGK